jgi:TolB-like protein
MKMYSKTTPISILFLCAMFSVVSSFGQVPFMSKTFDKQMNKLSKEMVKSLSEVNKTKIAILEFPDLNGNITELGKFIPEELTTRFFKTKKFNVVERQLLSQILKEQNLGMTGLLDASSAAQVGKMAGVDAIVTGTISDLGTSIRVNARLISTESATVFAVASVDLPRDAHLMSMFGKTIETDVAPVGKQGGADSKDKGKAAAGTPTWEEKNFSITLKSCNKNQTRMRIELTLKNTGEDRELQIGDVFAYDDLGNKYSVSLRELANQSNDKGGWFINKVVANVNTKLAFEFKEVDGKAKNITLLEIKLWEKKAGHFDAKLRDIKIK